MKHGYHWRYDNKGKPHKIGVWFGGTPYNRRIYIPFINSLWIR
jgi:hypothetical protein